MNYIGALVKVLETPKRILLDSDIFIIKFRVQLPQIKKVKIVELICWGSLAKAVFNYYKANDYLLIEGYVSFSNNNNKDLKKIKITALKIYPFLLTSKSSLNKLL